MMKDSKTNRSPINIALVLEGEGASIVRKLNRQLGDVVDPAILFGDEHNLPHITLAMAVIGEVDFSELKRLIAQI
ncbi:MAG: hypothetical protein ACI84C_002512 [Flavobacteriales bacterium]|jgi:hypothetical protein